MHTITRALASLKAASVSVMRWSRGQGWAWWRLGSTEIDWDVSAGDGRTNAAVMACIRWVQRALPEAPIMVTTRNAQGEMTAALDHPLQARLDGPNPYYSGMHLLGAVVADLMLTGNAYIRKIRSGRSRVAELWWIPSSQMEPRWPEDDHGVYISHYDYTIDGQVDVLDPSDIVHIRQGFDPQNIRKGLSDFAALVREVATDNEAANWSASMVRNVNPPGVVVMPGKDVDLTRDDAERIKGDFNQRMSGDRKGSTLVLSAQAEVKVLSFTPEQMNLRSLRQIPEERITAVFGIPAAVVGLGAGLDTTKVGATMREMREQAYESALIPLQRLIAAELQLQLVHDFGNPATLRVEFDLSGVRVLQDDQNALHERARADLTAGLLTLNQALQMVGQDVLMGPEGDVRFVPNTVTVTPTDALIPAPAALPEPTPIRALPSLSEGSDGAVATRSVAQHTHDLSPGRVHQRARQTTASAPYGDDGAALVDSTLGVEVRGAEACAPSGLTNCHAAYGNHGYSVARKTADDIPDDLARQRRDAEAQWTADLAAFLAAQSVRVSGRLTGAEDTAEALVPDIEADLLRATLEPRQRDVLASVLDVVTGQLGLDFELDDPATRAYLTEAGSQIVGITETTRSAVQAALVEGQTAGDGVSQLAARLRDLPAFDQARANVVARTELGNSQNSAALATYRASGIVVGVRIHDGDSDAACAAMNGRTFLLADAPAQLQHPNCLTGDTIVVAPNVSAGFLRWFDGEVVIIKTAANDLLTCTPNHPVLTGDGWVAAGNLRQGDHVIRSLNSQGIARKLNPDDDYRPAMIQQVVDALGPASGGTTATMPSAAEDFHGDGTDGNVYVVRANGLAKVYGDPSLLKDRGEGSVMVADAEPKTLAGLGSADQFLFSSRHTTDSIVGSPRAGLSDFGGEFGLSHSGGIVPGSRQPFLAKPLQDGCSIDVEHDGDFRRTEVFNQIELTEPICAGMASKDVAESAPISQQARLADTDAIGYLGAGFTGLIAPVQVIEVERRKFAGHVYNLETNQGWYIANNIITHNCVRSFAPLTDVSQIEGAA